MRILRLIRRFSTGSHPAVFLFTLLPGPHSLPLFCTMTQPRGGILFVRDTTTSFQAA